MEWKIGDSLLSKKTNSKAITVGKVYKIVSMLPYNHSSFKAGQQKFSILDNNGIEKIVNVNDIYGLWNHLLQES